MEATHLLHPLASGFDDAYLLSLLKLDRNYRKIVIENNRLKLL
jgi:hypothetical protein